MSVISPASRRNARAFQTRRWTTTGGIISNTSWMSGLAKFPAERAASKLLSSSMPGPRASNSPPARVRWSNWRSSKKSAVNCRPNGFYRIFATKSFRVSWLGFRVGGTNARLGTRNRLVAQLFNLIVLFCVPVPAFWPLWGIVVEYDYELCSGQDGIIVGVVFPLMNAQARVV